jgi:hypothetical protein
MQDYGDIVNALLEGPSVPAVASFNVDWTASHDRHHFRYPPEQWEGNFVFNTARCAWRAQTKTAMFVSDAASTSTSLFAEVGHERNGVFFH